jgi:hypothetical protein
MCIDKDRHICKGRANPDFLQIRHQAARQLRQHPVVSQNVLQFAKQNRNWTGRQPHGVPLIRYLAAVASEWHESRLSPRQAIGDPRAQRHTEIIAHRIGRR